MPSQTDFRPTPQRAATRVKVIEAAIVVLERDGFAGTTWRSVAAEAGVTGGVLQYHFGDKATMLTAVVEHLAQTHADVLRESVAPSTAPIRQRVESFADTAYELLTGPSQIALMEVLVGSRTADAPLLPGPVLTATNRTFDDLWREVFADAPVDRRRLLAARHLLFATLYGFAVQRLFAAEIGFRDERRALVDAVTSLLTDH